MQVSEDVKNAYKQNSVTKHLTLYFPGTNTEIGTEMVYFETLRLSESLMSSDSIEFVGCIASKFSVQVYGISDDIKGKKISARVHTDGTEDEPVTLFNGIVDSVVMESNHGYKKITAYDILFSLGNVSCIDWYNSLQFPVTIKEIRDSLFDYLEIEQVECTLPNDDIEVSSMYEPDELSALDCIKSICQINAAFGIINREGKFEYRFPQDAFENSEDIPFYKNVEYEEYSVKPVDKIVIRKNEKDKGVSFGAGTNNYIIQGNIFAYELENDVLAVMAENIYHRVYNFFYNPFDSDNNGLPYFEVGTGSASYEVMDPFTKEYSQKSFFVLRRELSGLQSMRDVYGADGDEYQSEFITDINVRISSLEKSYEETAKQKMVVYTYRNKSRYSVGPDEEKEIIKINYAALEDATPVFSATVPIEVDGAGDMILRYYTDKVLSKSDTLKQKLDTGNHFLTLSNFFKIKKNRRATLTVTAQTSAAEMYALIAASTIKAVLFAHGLVGEGGWDGTINLSDEIGTVRLGKVTALKPAVSLSVTKPQLRRSSIEESIGLIGVGKQKFSGISAVMSVSSEDAGAAVDETENESN